MHICLCTTWMQGQWNLEEGIRCSNTGVIGHYEPLCGCCRPKSSGRAVSNQLPSHLSSLSSLFVCCLKHLGNILVFALVSKQHESEALNTILLAHNSVAQKPGMVWLGSTLSCFTDCSVVRYYTFIWSMESSCWLIYVFQRTQVFVVVVGLLFSFS